MVISVHQLKDKYANYSNPIAKINRDIKKGKLFPLVKGLYETDPNVSNFLLGQFIYGPSYISFEYALAHYGLIPEAVYALTCASFNKNKTKTYKNKFGYFMYRDIPQKAYPEGVNTYIYETYSYQMATAEKALCDKLYTVSPPIKNQKELKELLFENLRIDEEEFDKLDKEEMLRLAPLYHSTNLKILANFIKGEMKKCTKH